MTDGISRRELKKAIEEASENMARSAWQDATISVSKDTHDALRKEAGLDPSHPGMSGTIPAPTSSGTGGCHGDGERQA
ncbi:hypothetical protein HCTV5_155 [Halovirus HCTV-5]|uniref:hypothetical protein n=1 Tax=Halovirus HCTV-5 TaxID=1273748 RepID=UPI00033485DE|nr:hypothetical protein M200_gp075 [Halovirus HCTV-5]AGM11759.1 hypothetical protein HCTV5_155 [Halovirus HCTV-5]